MNKIKCRTCFDVLDRKNGTEVTKPCYSGKTVKDAIIVLVPGMVSTLSDDELICENCLGILGSSLKFIERCLEVEIVYAENKDQFKYNECIYNLLNGVTENNEFDKDAENEEQFEDTEYVDDLLDDTTTNNEVVEDGKNKEQLNTDNVDDLLKKYENSEFDAEPVLFTEDKYRIEIDHNYCVTSKLDEQSYIKYDPKHSIGLAPSENIIENDNCVYQCSEVMSKSPVTSGQNLEEDDNSFYQYSGSTPTEILLQVLVSGNQNIETGNKNFDTPIQILFEDSLTKDERSDNNAELESHAVPDGDVSEDLQSEKGFENYDKRYFTCSSCSETFSSKDEYDVHLEIHPSFVCHFCGKRLENNDSYRNHMNIHNSKTVCLCEFCGKGFKSNSAVTLHIMNKHKEERTHRCDKCPKTFKDKFKLHNHVMIVHEKLGRQQCQGCGKLFQSKEACENHYRLIHLQLKPFVCDICGQHFGRKDYLKKHMYHHTGEPRPYKKQQVRQRRPRFGIRLRDPGKPVPCKVCGKQISKVHILKAHLQTHVRIKRFQCRLCELTFTLAANRDRHEKLHEADPDNKFRCNICWKRLRTEEELEGHIISHCNRPPRHSCDICGEKFHRKYLLDNHLLSDHTGPGDIEKAEEEIVLKNLLEYADR